MEFSDTVVLFIRFDDGDSDVHHIWRKSAPTPLMDLINFCASRKSSHSSNIILAHNGKSIKNDERYDGFSQNDIVECRVINLSYGQSPKSWPSSCTTQNQEPQGENERASTSDVNKWSRSLNYSSPELRTSASSELDYDQEAEQFPYPSMLREIFLRPNEVLRIVDFWKEESALGSCSSATHIMDPLAHYAHLDYIEGFLVARSGYFRCSGKYNTSSDEDIYEDDMDLEYQLDNSSIISFPQRGRNSRLNTRHFDTPLLGVRHLRMSYSILSNVLKELRILRGHSFCREFYSILVLHPKKNVAEMVKIQYETLEALKSSIESLKDIDPESEITSFILRDKIARPCMNLLLQLQFPLAIQTPDNTDDILILLRMSVLVFDLGLLCYVGSHGSRFDTILEKEPADRIMIRSNSPRIRNVMCSLKPLACLGDFLDNAMVWVFEYCQPMQEKVSLAESVEETRLSILADIVTFADVWGPVWASTYGRHIIKYNLSRGCIRPVVGSSPVSNGDDGQNSTQQQQRQRTIECHWFRDISMPSQIPEEMIHLRKEDKLLIGAGLRPNPHCPYTLDHFERDFGHDMTDLGTRAECWGLDVKTVGLTAGQYINLSVSGTQKRLPGVTLKEKIRNSMSFSPRNANIAWLNNYLGIEISPCTGHSRRIRFRELLCSTRIQNRLEQYHPNWKQTEWGRKFHGALVAPTFQIMKDVWKIPDLREPIANFLCQILELLHDTGLRGPQLIAAYFNDDLDKQVHLKSVGNEWAECLKDSEKTAAYVIIGEICLECSRRMGVTAGSCRQETSSGTVLQTRIMFRDNLPCLLSDYVSLHPFDKKFRVVDVDNERWIVLAPVESDYMIRIRRQKIKPAVEIIERLGYHDRREELRALIMATTDSYGGMGTLRRLTPINRHHAQDPHQLPQSHNSQKNQARRSKKRRVKNNDDKRSKKPSCCMS